ncbi:MAG: MBL fold metallo-hydrolase [Clostridia bacterium]|nr:MBL fold metallo-hydrolase [Clostridia bacterium]
MRIKPLFSRFQKAGPLLLLALILLFSACTRVEKAPELSWDPDVRYPLSVTFFNLGKADCMVLKTPNGCVVIDTGRNSDGDDIAEALHEMGVTEIDCLFITHFDKDHVGGADRILKEFPVKTIYEPDYPSETKQTAQYRKAIPETTNVVRLSENNAFTVDGIRYSVDVGDGAYEPKNLDNNSSLVILAEIGSVSFLFAGDVEKDRLLEMLYEDFPVCTVLKVPHHGQESKNLKNFFERVRPSAAVITSGNEDLEAESVVRDLESIGTDVYLTRKGRVEIITDGTGIFCRQLNRKP